MNNEPSDKDIQSTATRDENSLFASRRAKSRLFFGVLISAMAISLYFVFRDDMPMESIPFIGIMFPSGIWILIYDWLHEGSIGSEAALLFPAVSLWAIYIGILIIGIRSRSVMISKVLFIVLVLLLLLNIGGCATWSAQN